jgi:hypothetical protein
MRRIKHSWRNVMKVVLPYEKLERPMLTSDERVMPFATVMRVEFGNYMYKWRWNANSMNMKAMNSSGLDKKTLKLTNDLSQNNVVTVLHFGTKNLTHNVSKQVNVRRKSRMQTTRVTNSNGPVNEMLMRTSDNLMMNVA